MQEVGRPQALRQTSLSVKEIVQVSRNMTDDTDASKPTDQTGRNMGLPSPGSAKLVMFTISIFLA